MRFPFILPRWWTEQTANRFALTTPRPVLVESTSGNGRVQIPPSVRIGTWIQSPVHQSRVTVEGDLLQAGAIKQGEGVVLQKTRPGDVSDRSEFRQGQGEDTHSTTASAICPNCGEFILEC